MKHKHSLSGLILTLTWFLSACTEPPVIPYKDAPIPTGVIKGSILYIGPPAQCEDNKPTGQLILTLFLNDNPPPPAGTALSPVNMLSMKASSVFSEDDCGLLEADPSSFVQRSASFVWPNIPLGTIEGDVASYQIRGFLDYDSDFNPFFGVRKQPTAGDIVGGAYIDPTAAVKAYAPINFQSLVERPQGQVVSNITVTLAAPVVTERPMFELGPETEPMDSGTVLTIMDSDNPTAPQLDPQKYEEGLWQQNQMTIVSLDTSDTAYDEALLAAGIQVEDEPYPWMLEPVDFYGGADGVADYFPLFATHPILGDEGSILSFMDGDYLWKTPLVFFTRARRPEEIQGNVPNVTLIGTVRQVLAPEAPVLNSIEIIVPPVALVNLDPTDPACQIPYFAPGNTASAFETRPSECQELPTGEYDIAVFHGFAATLVDGVPTYVFTGQAWVIPNELGPTDTMYLNPTTGQLPENMQLVSQGPTGRFRVVENTSSNGVRNQCEEGMDFLSAEPGMRPINYQPVPENCCAAVKHLCDIPLCETVAAQAGGRIRRSNSTDPVTGLPQCVPFFMPSSCCE
ncbi:MAG: hypothetical protein HOK97_08120 [Deltaproteobacteria bacterium]|nr:hypothetical protein [Deltaproteobacteria bacterium]